MKNAKLFSAAFFVLCLSLGQMFAQKTIVWKGGHPGHANDWNCPQNWVGGTLPDAFSDVVIPDESATGHYYPTLGNGSVSVNSLFLDGAATLSIASTARLVVFGNCLAVNASNIHAAGFFRVLNEGYDPPASDMARL